MNKLKRILCAMLCVCMISIPMAIPTTVSAEDSISDLEQQLQQLEQENQKYQKILDDTKSDIAEKEEYKSALVSKVQVLDEKIAVTREKISSLNDDIKEKQDAYDNALMKTVTEVLGVIDNFERAASAECSDEQFKKGIDMIFKQYLTILEKLGVSEINAVGQPFDPNLHNAVSSCEDESLGENTVAAVLQKGYTLGKKVIRHAMVTVANP